MAAVQSHEQSAATMVEAILQSMDRFSHASQADDATVAVIRVT